MRWIFDTIIGMNGGGGVLGRKLNWDAPHMQPANIILTTMNNMLRWDGFLEAIIVFGGL